MKKNPTFNIIILIMTLALAYSFRAKIMIAGTHVGAYFGSASAERALGEYYSHRSMFNSQRAAYHFERALRIQKKELPYAPEEMRKWIYYIIASHYECGKGIKQDLHAAKEWYQKAADEGLEEGLFNLKVIEKALADIKKAHDKELNQ